MLTKISQSVPFAAVFTASLLFLTGCGLSRSTGQRVEITGTVVIPENLFGEDVDQLRATLNYETPKWYSRKPMYTYYDWWNQIEKGHYPWGRQPSDRVEEILEICDGVISIHISERVYAHSTPLIQIFVPHKRTICEIRFGVAADRKERGNPWVLDYKDFVIDLRPSEVALSNPSVRTLEYLVHAGDPVTLEKRGGYVPGPRY